MTTAATLGAGPAGTNRSLLPRVGRLSDRAFRLWVRPGLTLLALVPLGLVVWQTLQAFNPAEAAVRGLGDWAIRLLLLALAVTPLKDLTGWRWLGRLRRRAGIVAFWFVVLHILAYVGLDHAFDLSVMWADLLNRVYIMVGMAAFVILLALAITSTDGMVRRVGGRRWRRLHQAVYLAAILAVVHHYMMIRADHTVAWVHAGALAALLGWRVWRWLRPSLLRRGMADASAGV